MSIIQEAAIWRSLNQRLHLEVPIGGGFDHWQKVIKCCARSLKVVGESPDNARRGVTLGFITWQMFGERVVATIHTAMKNNN